MVLRTGLNLVLVRVLCFVRVWVIEVYQMVQVFHLLWAYTCSPEDVVA